MPVCFAMNPSTGCVRVDSFRWSIDPRTACRSSKLHSQRHLIGLIRRKSLDVRMVWVPIERNRLDFPRGNPAITGENIHTPDERTLAIPGNLPADCPGLVFRRIAMAIHGEFNPLVRNKESKFDRSIRSDMRSLAERKATLSDCR